MLDGEGVGTKNSMKDMKTFFSASHTFDHQIAEIKVFGSIDWNLIYKFRNYQHRRKKMVDTIIFSR